MPLSPAEIRWGRGTANGMFVGNFTDLANWNADDVSPDAPRIPADIDRARVDRSDTNMTFDSQIAVGNFLFGVDEAGQQFTFEPTADVTLTSNYFVAFNEGDVTVDIQEGALLTVGGNFLLGQWDGKNQGALTMDGRDITVSIAGMVDNSGGATILGDKYGVDASGNPSSSTTSERVDILLDITTGTLKTKNIRFAPNGDLATYLATNTVPGNENTMGIRLGAEGRIVIVGSDATSTIRNLVANGLLYPDSATGTIQALFDGTDTQVQVALAGDYNGDGMVNVADYTVWRDTLGQTGSGLPADGDGGGAVDAADYEFWKQRFGNATTVAFAASRVPEPSGLLAALVMSGIFALLFRARVERPVVVSARPPRVR